MIKNILHEKKIENIDHHKKQQKKKFIKRSV